MRLKQKLILISFGILVLFLLLEIGLRIGGQVYYSYRINNKNTQIDNKHTVRILCIGDSFTFGVGAEKDLSYPEQLEKILNRDYQKYKFIVYNRGIPGVNSSITLKELLRDLDKYKPHFVIIMSGADNVSYLKGSNYFLFKNRDSKAIFYRLDAFLSRLHSYKFLKILIANLRNKIFVMYHRRLNKIQFTKKNNNNNLLTDERIINEIESHLGLGMQYWKSRDFSFAIRELKMILDKQPEHWMSLLILGDIYDCQEEYELAEACLRKAIAINPNCVDAYDALWQVYWHSGKNDSALQTLREALRLNPSDEDLRQILRNGLPSTDEKWIFDKLFEYDLQNMIKLSRERKARVILQNYPFDDGNDDIRRYLVSKWEIPFVDNKEYFKELMSENNYKREDYFVEDGHCNANGYHIIAQNVYKVLRSELREIFE